MGMLFQSVYAETKFLKNGHRHTASKCNVSLGCPICKLPFEEDAEVAELDCE
jgi:hypothetical protein